MSRRKVQIILLRKYKCIIDVKICCQQLSAVQIKRIEWRGGKSLGVKKVALLIQQMGKNQQKGWVGPGAGSWWGGGDGCPSALCVAREAVPVRNLGVSPPTLISCPSPSESPWLLLLCIWYTELHRTSYGHSVARAALCLVIHYETLLSKVSGSEIISSVFIKMKNLHTLGDCPESHSREKDTEFLYPHWFHTLSRDSLPSLLLSLCLFFEVFKCSVMTKRVVSLSSALFSQCWCSHIVGRECLMMLMPN